VREVVLAIIDIAIMVGLLWSLWFVFAYSRRQRKRLSEQLAAPLARTESRVLVRPDLRVCSAAAFGFAWLTVLSSIKAVEGSQTSAVFAVVCVAVCAFYGRRALLRRPVLTIDGRGLTIGNSTRAIPWSAVQQVRVVEYASTYGVTRHRLDCDIAREDGTGTDEVTVPLETLSLPWHEVVMAVQNRMGRRVVVVR